MTNADRTRLTFGQISEIVRHETSVNMSHPGARNPNNRSSTLPDLEMRSVKTIVKQGIESGEQHYLFCITVDFCYCWHFRQ